jgi:hypothetical protein
MGQWVQTPLARIAGPHIFRFDTILRSRGIQIGLSCRKNPNRCLKYIYAQELILRKPDGLNHEGGGEKEEEEEEEEEEGGGGGGGVRREGHASIRRP